MGDNEMKVQIEANGQDFEVSIDGENIGSVNEVDATTWHGILYGGVDFNFTASGKHQAARQLIAKYYELQRGT